MLEHTANPLEALNSWKSVVIDDGLLILVLPHRDGTFDHLRPLTSVQHLVDDFESQKGENDSTHFEEIANRHDFFRDSGMSSSADVALRLQDNLGLRSIHHHVFALENATTMVEASGWAILHAMAIPRFHILIVATVVPTDCVFTLDQSKKFSPFPSERFNTTL